MKHLLQMQKEKNMVLRNFGKHFVQALKNYKPRNCFAVCEISNYNPI